MLKLPVLPVIEINFISQQLLFRGNISMERSFRLADAMNSMTHQEIIMILAIKWFRLSLSGFWNNHSMAVYKTVTPPWLLRRNEPSNEARVDSLCETFTGKIFTRHFRSCVKWAVPFNKGTPPLPPYGWKLFAYPSWAKNFALTPLGQTVVYGELRILLKFTRDYGDILACQYPLGQTLKDHP